MPAHLNIDQLVALLLQARVQSEADFVMFLLTFHHALRESEVVGQKTTQRGQFQVRQQAEMRLAEVTATEPDNPAEIREKQIRIKRHRRTVWQVHVKEARIVGGLKPENFSRGYIYLDRLKGSNAVREELATDPWLSPDIIERPIVEEFLRTHAAAHLAKDGGDGEGKLLFPINRKTYWERMQKYGTAAAIPEHLCHPHILKHSIGKFLLRQMKLPIDIVQQRMGHKDMSSTGAYLGADETEVGLEVAKAGLMIASRWDRAAKKVEAEPKKEPEAEPPTDVEKVQKG